MNHELGPTGHYVNLTRRDALMRALKGAVTAVVSAPILMQAASPTPEIQHEAEYVPENDYPFFGGELPPSMR